MKSEIANNPQNNENVKAGSKSSKNQKILFEMFW